MAKRKAKKPLCTETHCADRDAALGLLKYLCFRRHSNGLYYRKRRNYNISAKHQFEHDTASVTPEGHINFTYKESIS